MKYLVLIMCLSFAGTVYARQRQPMKVERLTIEHKKIESKRDPYFPNKDDWTNKTNLFWDVEIYEFFFWENNTYMEMDHSVRHIGWQYQMGFHLFPHVDAVWDHHSRHVAEQEPAASVGKFPVEDSYGVRIYFIGDR